jgi:hypothetical protein
LLGEGKVTFMSARTRGRGTDIVGAGFGVQFVMRSWIVNGGFGDPWHAIWKRTSCLNFKMRTLCLFSFFRICLLYCCRSLETGNVLFSATTAGIVVFTKSIWFSTAGRESKYLARAFVSTKKLRGSTCTLPSTPTRLYDTYNGRQKRQVLRPLWKWWPDFQETEGQRVTFLWH